MSESEERIELKELFGIVVACKVRPDGRFWAGRYRNVFEQNRAEQVINVLT